MDRGSFPAFLALGLGMAGPAAAQTAASPESRNAGPLEEIVVTARRQSEALQNTPVAVTALSSRLLEQLNVQQVTTVAKLTPNLQILPQSTGATAATVSIRGIGQQEPAVTAEAGVGIYLDGVYIARTAGSVFDLVDLERIEVLRGPQGTLFGRNTTGGAIQLISRKPDQKLGAEVKAGIGSFSEWYSRARFDTGEIGASTVRASVAYLHRQRHGYVDNTLAPSSQDPGALNSEAVWASVIAEPSEKLSLRYTFDFNHRFGVSDYFQIVAATPATAAYFGASPSFGGSAFVISADRRSSGEQAPASNGEFGAVARSSGHALTIEWGASPALTIKSISAYRRFRQESAQTLSGSGYLLGQVVDSSSPTGISLGSVTPFNGYNRIRQRQWSQELQLLGSSGSFNYLAGAFYFKEKGSEALQQELTLILPGGVGLNLPPFQGFNGSSTSYALFGQLSFRPDGRDGKLELTGGLRHTWDKKTITLNSTLFGAPTATGSGERDFRNLSWSATANYQFTPDVMAYARVSSGYKSGGFSPRASVIAPFNPEKAIAYEVGLKSELLNRRVRLNLAAFRTDYNDLQIQQFSAGSGGASSLIVNAGKVTFQGLEGEVTAVPVRGLTLTGSFGYTDPKYKQFIYRDPVTDALIDVADEARMPQAAKLNWNIGAEYTFDELSLGKLSLRADYSWRGRIYFFALDRQAPFNREISSPHAKDLSARATLSDIPLGSGPKRLDVSLWGANLTNANNRGFGVDFGSLGFAGVTYLPPRSVGIDAKIAF